MERNNTHKTIVAFPSQQGARKRAKVLPQK